jgi:hypothetical protein
MESQIQELSLAVAGIDLQLAMEKVEDMKRNLSIELQRVRDDRRDQWQEFQEYMNELREALDQIRAQHLIEAQLLDLVGKQNAGDQKEEERDSGGNSGESGLQTAFVSHLRRRGLHQDSSSQSL